MSSYVRQQRDEYPTEETPTFYSSPSFQQNSSPPDSAIDFEGKRSLVPHTDANGVQFRPKENGRVIPRGDILNRIVGFWELFITTSVLFGYHIVTGAASHIRSPHAINIFLYHACESINYQSDVDLCAASALAWSLIGGAVLYFIVTSIIAVFIYLECRRNGYPALFTAVWNSPFFIFCYLFGEEHRIDLLSISNKLMGFRKWTHIHVHHLLLSMYALMTTMIIAYDLTKRTVDSSDFDANEKSIGTEFYSHIYNPYFLPYYVAMYLYIKTIITSGFAVRNLLDNEKSEMVAVFYMGLKQN